MKDNKIITKEDIKNFESLIFNCDNINDNDFNDFIYYIIIPLLKNEYGIKNIDYQKVLEQDY